MACTVILVPGIQGRWEWLKPAIRCFEPRYRVVTFSLYAVTGPPYFPAWDALIDREIDRAGADNVVLVGVSFGGVVAAHYATRSERRLSALVLASTPSPRWEPDPAQLRYLKRPRLSVPLFAARAIRRMAPEVAAAHQTWPARLRFLCEQTTRAIRWGVKPAEMAAWVREWQSLPLADDFRRITLPTLVLTGEPALDRVVPVASSLDYLELICGAQHVMLPKTGHLGVLARPDAFAALIDEFLSAQLNGPTEKGAQRT